jgi:F-type H+-transporting ATPase subunit epsilon
MRLIVTTPTAVIVDRERIRHVRAEDETGAFGILPGHTRFLTCLAVSVLSWRDEEGREGHVAVRGGVLQVEDGVRVQVASREAVAGDDLEILAGTILEGFRKADEAEISARTASRRLELAAIQQIRRYLHPEQRRHRPSPGLAEHGPPPPKVRP